MALTKSKAKKILRENMAHGKKLTAKQKKFFKAAAGGHLKKTTKTKRRKQKRH